MDFGDDFSGVITFDAWFDATAGADAIGSLDNIIPPCAPKADASAALVFHPLVMASDSALSASISAIASMLNGGSAPNGLMWPPDALASLPSPMPFCIVNSWPRACAIVDRIAVGCTSRWARCPGVETKAIGIGRGKQGATALARRLGPGLASSGRVERTMQFVCSKVGALGKGGDTART